MGVAGCQGIDTRVYTGEQPKTQSKFVVDLGRRYAVVVAGNGVEARDEPDPRAMLRARYGFGAVVLTRGEATGTDSAFWRRIEGDKWAPRDGLIVFPEFDRAVDLAIELRVFAARALRQTLIERDTPPGYLRTAGPTATPTLPTLQTTAATPTPTALPPEEFYGVVTVDTALYELPGGRTVSGARLTRGAAIVVVDRAIGQNGQVALKLASHLWAPADSVAIFLKPTEATAVAYLMRMANLHPRAEVDPNLSPALWLLAREPKTLYLANAIRDLGIPLRVGQLPRPDVIAIYDVSTRSITVNAPMMDLDVRVLAAALAHEATHAWEHAQGLRLDRAEPARCFEAELRALQSQAMFWQALHGPEGKVRVDTREEEELNDLIRLLRQDPDFLKRRLVNLYGDQCGYHGPRPALEPVGAPRP
ncbi:MAG: hypothetical protein FJ033_10305 [Chloroflexi bacterium]|nr:hypothetical protein [Chloroflexota bacterium]